MGRRTEGDLHVGPSRAKEALRPGCFAHCLPSARVRPLCRTEGQERPPSLRPLPGTTTHTAGAHGAGPDGAAVCIEQPLRQCRLLVLHGGPLLI